MNRQDFPAPTEGFVVTHTLIVEDIDRSADFYVNVLGATEVMRIPDGPAILGSPTRGSSSTSVVVRPKTSRPLFLLRRMIPTG